MFSPFWCHLPLPCPFVTSPGAHFLDLSVLRAGFLRFQSCGLQLPSPLLQVNLKRPCPFWPDDGHCAIKDCHVEPCPEVRGHLKVTPLDVVRLDFCIYTVFFSFLLQSKIPVGIKSGNYNKVSISCSCSGTFCLVSWHTLCLPSTSLAASCLSFWTSWTSIPLLAGEAKGSSGVWESHEAEGERGRGKVGAGLLDTSAVARVWMRWRNEEISV